MAFVIVENLRGFFIGRPPLVVFMVCLASFAIALITFAYIVKTKDLRNPDVTEDWNTFFEKLSHLKFCVSHNVTSHNLSTPSVKVGDLTPGDALESIKDRIIENKISSNPSHTINRAVLEPQASLIRSQAAYSDRSKSESTTAQKQTTWSPSADPVSKDDTINDTFHLNIEFVPSSEFLISTFKSVYLTSDVTGNMLGLKGIHKDQHVTITVSILTNESECVEKIDGICSMYVINSCITFIGPASMLPRARHGKKSSCHRETSSSSWTSSNHIRPMSASVSTVSNNENNWCLPGSTLAVQYSFDDSLTVLLSPEDRSVINLHLMRTSYFLFVMVVTLFCYAAVKGRSGKVKTVIHVPHDKVKSFIQP